VGGPNTLITNLKWRTAAILKKIEKSPLLGGQNRYAAGADWGVLDVGTYLRNLANTIDLPVCSIDAVIYQINLTTHY